MQTHKFQVGQKLVFSPSRQEARWKSAFCQVARLLPADGSELLYRIRHIESGQERVARESQLQHPRQ